MLAHCSQLDRRKTILPTQSERSLSSPLAPCQSHSHTVNLLSALPLQCLDVLLVVPLEPDSKQCLGVNMDCVHMLLIFMERRLDLVREKAT